MLGVPARPVPCCFLYYQAGIMLGSFRLKAWQAKQGGGTLKMLVELVARGIVALVNECIHNGLRGFQTYYCGPMAWGIQKGVKMFRELHACQPHKGSSPPVSGGVWFQGGI